jgi:hypothetical protein
LEHLQVSGAEQLLKAKRSDNAAALAHRLLSAMSDAVVHLDDELCIAKESPQFGSLTLCSSSEPDLTGKRFVDFLRSEDVQRFESSLAELWGGYEGDALAEVNAEESTRVSQVRVIHTHLLDKRRAYFAVQLFIAYIPDFHGIGACYMIGVKEEGEEKMAVNVDENALTIPESAFSVRTTSIQNDRLDGFPYKKACSVSERSYHSADTSSSGSGDAYSHLPFCTMAFRFMVSDIFENRLRVMDFSGSMAALFGPSLQPGCDIFPWISCNDRKNLQKQFSDLSRERIHIEGDIIAWQAISIQFQPPHTKRHKLYIDAELDICLSREVVSHGDGGCVTDDLDDADDDDEDWSIFATLRNVNWTGSKKREPSPRRQPPRPRQTDPLRASMLGATIHL